MTSKAAEDERASERGGGPNFYLQLGAKRVTVARAKGAGELSYRNTSEGACT